MIISAHLCGSVLSPSQNSMSLCLPTNPCSEIPGLRCPEPKHAHRMNSTSGSWQSVLKCTVTKCMLAIMATLVMGYRQENSGKKGDGWPFSDSLCLYLWVCACREDRRGKELKALHSTKSQAKEEGKGILWAWLEELLQEWRAPTVPCRCHPLPSSLLPFPFLLQG